MLSTLKTLSIDGIFLKQLAIDGVIAWEEPSSYTNQVPISIDTDGSIYNSCGYMDGYRLSSSGSPKATDKCTTTGFIEATSGDTIRIAGVSWAEKTASYNYLCCYDENFNHLGAFTSYGSSYGEFLQSGSSRNIIEENGITTVTFNTLSTTKYIRLSYYDPEGIIGGKDMIVTVNEEIS